MSQENQAGARKPISAIVIVAWALSVAALMACVWLTRG